MNSEIILYQSNELPEHIEVRLDEERETFWLSLNQIANLFERDKSVISRHLKNIFKESELDKESVVAFLQQLHRMVKLIMLNISTLTLFFLWVIG
jgi:hypothetical protein